jgi:hypothetical protein
MLGLCKLDIEDRINYYNEAKHSKNATIRDTSISRLMNIYYKIFKSTRQLKSSKGDSVVDKHFSGAKQQAILKGFKKIYSKVVDYARHLKN